MMDMSDHIFSMSSGSDLSAVSLEISGRGRLSTFFSISVANPVIFNHDLDGIQRTHHSLKYGVRTSVTLCQLLLGDLDSP